MPTFIKAGFWRQLCTPCNGYRGWLNLEELITKVVGPGTPGPVGPQGPQGIQGVQGVQGIQGETGAQGTAGNSVTILGSYADLAAFNAGAGSLPGVNIGDAWILLSDGSLMSWNGTNWFDAGDIKGPQGDQGIQGIQGVQGPQGIQGVPGPTGTTGLFAQLALGTLITNTTVETSLVGTGVGSLTVPANGFNVGDSFTVKMCGLLSCANNETIHIRVKSDGVTIADAGIFEMKIATDRYFELALDFTVTKIGVAGVAELFTNGQYSYNHNAAGEIAGNNFALISNTVFDTTVINNLSITAEWGLAKTANKIQSQNFVLTKVY